MGDTAANCAGHINLESGGAVWGPGRLIDEHGMLVCWEERRQPTCRLQVDERPSGPKQWRGAFSQGSHESTVHGLLASVSLLYILLPVLELTEEEITLENTLIISCSLFPKCK